MPSIPRKPRPSEAGKYKAPFPRETAGKGDHPPPAWVIEERDRASAAADELLPGELHLGSPPPCRSALAGLRRRAGREFSAAFMLRTWEVDR